MAARPREPPRRTPVRIPVRRCRAPSSDPDWEPQFLDYLYLAFTNATAFSPTDVLPLSRPAKVTMMVQPAVASTVVVLVVARAVNVLG